MMELTYSMERSSSAVTTLSREGMGVMDVFKNMTYRFIEKDEWLMKGVLSASSVSTYPLDWTKLSSGIKKFSDVAAASLTADSNFGGNSVAKSQMTYVLVNNDTTNDFTTDQLKRLNILNNVWKKINLVKLGYNFDVDITSTFFMIKDTTNNKSILATFPGQNATVTNFTDYSFYTKAMADTNSFVTITLQNDPFSTGIPSVLGY